MVDLTETRQVDPECEAKESEPCATEPVFAADPEVQAIVDAASEASEEPRCARHRRGQRAAVPGPHGHRRPRVQPWRRVDPRQRRGRRPGSGPPVTTARRSRS
ncbi:hypothetical protein [Demequina litorisediminis]|uniref:hypothetical protein n=1 Tax=Demequina litorisediminis TaxID=1849022 RepID=UPI0024E0CB65|nr:hypothetical protein [Demequina litorisediminis]